MKILNGYACLGGNRKDWGEEHEVTAIEINPEIAAIYKDKFPNDTVIVTDAHQYLLDHYKEYDFIWLSPPCPSHSKMMKATRHDVVKYPDMKLYQEIILLQHFFKGKYVVENVQSYYDPLIPPKKIGRHYYWANFVITETELPKIKDMSRAKRSDMVDYLGFDYPGSIYINGNHCPVQILRNCVHPKEGKHILDCAMNIIRKSDTLQTSLF